MGRRYVEPVYLFDVQPLSVGPCTLTGGTALTSTALFGSVRKGMRVAGPGIPEGCKVASVTSTSALTLSAAGTDASGLTLSFFYIKGQRTLDPNEVVRTEWVQCGGAAQVVLWFRAPAGITSGLTTYALETSMDKEQVNTVNGNFFIFGSASIAAADLSGAGRLLRIYADSTSYPKDLITANWVRLVMTGHATDVIPELNGMAFTHW